MAKKLQLWNLNPAPGASPYAQRVRITLEEKKIEYDLHTFARDDKPQEFVQLYQSVWPDQKAITKVPTIVDTDGTRLTESTVIVEYLEQRYKGQGTQLVPDDAAKAAKARLFAEVFAANIQQRPLLEAETKAQVEEAKGKLLHGIKVVDAYLTAHGSTHGGSFLLGGTYSIAEVATAPFIGRIQTLFKEYRGIDVLAEAEKLGADRFVSWTKAVLDRPSTQTVLLPFDVLIPNWRTRVKQVRD